MLTPRNDRVSLPDDIYELLVYYYNDAYYDLEFITIAGASDKLILEEESENFIIVLPNITQHHHEVFDRAYHVSIYAKCRSTPKNVEIQTLCQLTPFKNA